MPASWLPVCSPRICNLRAVQHISHKSPLPTTKIKLLESLFNAGLSILCKGSRDTKVHSAFKLYDYDGDGFISLEEMEKYLTNVFKILFHTTPEVRKSMGVTAEELGQITAEQCFQECDLNKDNQLTFEEFKLWYSKPSLMSASFMQASEQLSVEEIQQITTLDQHSVSDVLSEFQSVCRADGTLSCEQFQEVLVMYASDDANITRVEALASTLYNLFDTNADGVVDCTEIASGACLVVWKLRVRFGLLYVYIFRVVVCVCSPDIFTSS